MSETTATRVSVFDFLAQKGLKGRAARDALSSGKVRLLGIPVADGTRSAPAEALAYNPSWPRLNPLYDIFLVHREAGFAVIYKPSNMLSVPAPDREENSALQAAAQVLGRALAVHRLDEGTSGLMLVARDEKHQDLLKELLEDRKVRRQYTGLCLNQPAEGVYHNFLVRDRGDGRRGVWTRPGPPPAEAREAITEVKVRSTFSRQGQSLSHFACRLQTGRTHQIRLHLSDVGCPLLGDELYGTSMAIKLFPRLALHAQKLVLPHPTTGKQLEFETPLPDDFVQFLGKTNH